MPSGGPRVPNKPAAVSGPGALSQRTDGGPGAKQPIRVPAGGAYGQRQTAEAQQAAAPMASGPPSIGGTPAVGGPRAGAAPDPGVFGPTELPNQPITTGVSGPAGGPTPDPDLILRQLVQVFPTPWMMRLLRRR
jgi:hypothetical protein